MVLVGFGLFLLRDVGEFGVVVDEVLVFEEWVGLLFVFRAPVLALRGGFAGRGVFGLAPLDFLAVSGWGCAHILIVELFVIINGEIN